MLRTGKMSMNYRLFPDRLKNLFGAIVAEEKTLDHWHYDMMGNTMMIRNDDGDYTPAHKSLLEFFVAIKLTAELGFLPCDFVDLARDQSHVDKGVNAADYTWEAYFRRQADENGEVRQIAPLKRFNAADQDQIMEYLGGAPEAILRFIHEITNVDEVREIFHLFLQNILEEFKRNDREPAKEQGIIGFIYRFRRLTQLWEKEAGSSRRICELWENYHKKEVQAAPGVSTIKMIIPGTGKGDPGALPIKMVQMPPGFFLMGDDREEPIHRVCISKAFLLGKNPVTNKLFSTIMGKSPSRFKGDDRPVERVTWFDAVNFCNRLSEKVGLKRFYTIDGENVTPNWDADGFRLPSEAEWEYACRSGTTGERYGEIDRIAWYEKNSNDSTQGVGKKEPNPWGLYDMLGNVWEWCWDWYGSYSNEDQKDWRGPEEGSARVLRGGGWDYSSVNCRASARNFLHPFYRGSGLGFRLARSA